MGSGRAGTQRAQAVDGHVKKIYPATAQSNETHQAQIQCPIGLTYIGFADSVIV